ncbi:hypothetical protein [uncultured Oscillibacter sp.]|uniref:hypothetical protein n=1 Tax=uncultured Oscillibacter sp. TaxID=876091 RepID=UPI002605E4BA|nr:hypothetical protein [uncultured Oscillibacter sp.]
MLLSEMSLDYKRDQLAFHSRIKELRAAAKAETDPRRAAALEARARDLEPLRREARELADLTARYYERGYYRNEQYTLQGKI